MNRILIVEDDPWLAESYARSLEAASYQTKTVAHALAAIHEIDDFKPDVILLDILLAGSTGFALLHELQSYADTGGIPVVVVTSLAGDLKKDELAAYGVKRVLDKATMKPEDVVAAVRSVA